MTKVARGNMKIPSIASKIIKLVTVILVAIALYALLGFQILPAVLTAKLPDLIQQQTGRKTSLEKLAFNPFTLRCRLQKFKMLEKNGQPFVSFDSFATKVNIWQSIKLKSLAIEEVTLSKPFVHVARLKNDDFNFADISKSKPEEKKKSNKLFPVNISKIAIVDGQVFWEDHHLDKSVQEKINPLNLKIDNFTTNADQESKLGITLALMSGGKLDWKGEIGVSPISSHGHISLNNIKLATLLALASPGKPAFELQGHELFTADYKLDYVKDKLKLSLNKSKLELVDVKFAKQQPVPIHISIPNVALRADYRIDQAQGRLALDADKAKLAIQDFQYEQKNQDPLLLKIFDISHELNVSVTKDDKALQVSTRQDKLAVRDVAFELQGKTGIAIKIPSLTHKAELNISKSGQGLQISTDKTALDIRELTFKQTGDTTRSIAIPLLTHEADLKFNQTDKELLITSNKDKLNLSKLQFLEQGENKRNITIPSISHEIDLKLSKNDKGLQVTANKAKLDVANLDFKDSGNKKMQVKIPRFSHETDLQFSLLDKTWQVSANKSKISSGNIQLSGMEMAKIALKIPELALETGYKTDNKDNTVNFSSSKGKFELHKVQMDATDNPTTLAKINAFHLAGIGFNLKNQELTLETVSGKDADFKAWLNADKTLNYQNLFPAAKPPSTRSKTKHVTVASKSPPKKPGNPWKVKVNNLALDNFGLDFEDRTQTKPIALSARPIDLHLKNFTTQAGASLPLQLSVGINKAGSIKIAGNTVLQPFSTQLAVNINKLAFNKYQPYVDKFAKLDIIDGNLNVDGQVKIAQKSEQTDVNFKGKTNIANLVTRDQVSNKDFVKWENLILSGIDVDLLANRYTVDSLLLNKPYARVTIRKDKTVNVKDIMIANNQAATSKSATTPAVAKKTSSSKKPYFRLNKAKIIDGASDFSDYSLILPFSAPIKGLNGGANGISSEQNSKITVALEGNAFELSPVKIKGSLSPYLGDFDVDMHFAGMPMPMVSPYMVQFAGYKVEKGKLTLGLKYQVEKKQLTASNNILIDQLELGEKVDNPNAVSLPLELAITLLKDSDGKIKIDVPLTGSLEDPKFNLGSLLADTLMNVLTKIITSPFNAIAGLVGSDADLSVVNFAAGEEALSTEQSQKLDDIAKALKEKPVLNLEIKGAAFTEQDWPVLRNDALHDQLRNLRAGEVNKDSDKKIRSEYVYLSADDYNRLLADVFIQQYPQLAKKSIFGTPKLINNENADFYAFAKNKMAESLQPDSKRLKDLATERAQSIAKYLVQKAGIPNDRIFILDTVVDPERDNKDITSQLSLKTN